MIHTLKERYKKVSKAMFHCRDNKQLIQVANGGDFDADATVWRGDDGSFVIGDGSDFDEDEATIYVEAGTLGEYATVRDDG